MSALSPTPTPAHQLQAEPAHTAPTTESHNIVPLVAPAGDVKATINYYNPPEDGSTPYNFVYDPPAGVPQRNFTRASHEVLIRDVRGHEGEVALDEQSFLPISGVSTSMTTADWSDEGAVQRKYYPEVEALLLKLCPGAHRVQIFDHTHRVSQEGAKRGPVLTAHIDQTPEAALARVAQHLPAEDVPALQAGRVRLINIWRPLRPVVTFPLAVGDSRTFKEDNLVAVEHRYPTKTGYTAQIRYDPEAQWWYWSGMDPVRGEVLALQCFDSETGGRAPHTAFVDPRSEGWEAERESVEVRALVFG
ncbi:hypothetical protein EJ06DRAFT_562712 [Trichodelitschia bisporula]|uniref:Methyltransferase n=1 Tax=Trichodelitschia bisporula TaxID=703511 RepID=A0A6G1HTP5_9PEZI|nr:hypothetical protein EJ06DRAFT_562712 [Trichodelitschia bisporula]